MSSTLPPFSTVRTSLPALTDALCILFEGSPILKTKLAPEIHALLPTSQVNTYHLLVYASLELLSAWDNVSKAEFIGGHPRIGEQSNLSALSAKEQTAKATPPDVLKRLEALNACYERKYPGLRYITFVNGRTRSEIAHEMDDFLGIAHDEVPNPESIKPLDREGSEWAGEVNRAVIDVGKIAQSRVKAMGVE